MENKYYVYFHIKATDDKIFYVGKGHGKRAFIKNNRSEYWENIVKKYGYYVKIIEENLTESEAFDKEKFYIEAIGRDNLCNLTNGGEGCSGVVLSDERKRNISEKLKGKIVSEETKIKLSLSSVGRRLSNETKVKISNTKKGVKNGPPSEDTKEKIRKSNTGKKHSEETKNRLSAYFKGKPSPLKGRQMSDEARKKMSDSAKKRERTPMTDETKRKISLANKGRKYKSS